MTPTNSRRRGMTLAEVVISTLLVSVLMLAALGSVGTAAISYRTSAAQADGADVAGELLAEILAMSYADPQSPTNAIGLDSGESTSGNRVTLDDIDDYHGFSESTLRTRAAASIPNYSGWSRSVVVERVSATDPSTTLSGGAPDSGLKRIRVIATGPSGRSFTAFALRADAGGLQQPSPSTSSVVTSVDSRLQLNGATSVTTGSAVVNHSVGN
jgi:prepilin-type N-terminal cleavage/methylation domain-containing protein